jgi:chromosome segregation ATPase
MRDVGRPVSLSILAHNAHGAVVQMYTAVIEDYERQIALLKSQLEGEKQERERAQKALDAAMGELATLRAKENSSDAVQVSSPAKEVQRDGRAW